MSDKDLPAFPVAYGGGRIEGMTLRDYFAAKAMQIAYAQIKEFPDEKWRIGVAMDAYLMADAMMEARK